MSHLQKQEDYDAGQCASSSGGNIGADPFPLLLKRLERIEAALSELLKQRVAKEWYTTAEVAETLDRADYTVREWCRQGRIRAKKKPCGRGKGGEWLVSHAELTRLNSEGLLPSGPSGK